ncbi:MAG: DUF1553 domain-containing protein, partial [Bacteroidota bacterium]
NDVSLAYEDLPKTIDFNQHIRPILSDRCWSCHGPDANARQAELRLDTEEGAFAALASGAGPAFKPGAISQSVAIDRMVQDDPDLLMPPPESQLTVSPREIALIAKWIDQGAKWKDHWAFLPIEAPEVPANPEGYVASNEIDHFINDRLAQEQQLTTGRADQERLLRRLHLDLTGLPPTPVQMDAWLADPSAKNYEKIVDELLATDAHAERLAMEWLDVARYADSHGMHADGWRLTWPYRDWIIRAFKANQPYDAFIRDQVAGDLIPNATKDQRIASAFNRMHPMTAEGGVIDEEMRLTYVFDRVNTVSTGLLGLTMDCSRCHDHKFDPISQEEYYGFSAFFNNFQELGMTGDDGNFGPYMLLGTDRTDSIVGQYDHQLAALQEARAKVAISAEALEAFLAKEQVAPPKPDYHLPLDNIREVPGGKRIDKDAWAVKSLELGEDPERGTVAIFDHAFDDIYFDEGIGAFDTHEPFSASIWFKTTKRDSLKTQVLMGTAGGKNAAWQGSDFYLDAQNRLNVRMIKVLPDDLLQVRTIDSLEIGRWYQACFTYDGSGHAAGLRLYVNGTAPPQSVVFDNLRGRAYPENHAAWLKIKARKLRIGQSYRAFTGENGIFLGALVDIRLYERALSPLEVARGFEPAAAASSPVAEEHLLRTHPEYQKQLGKYREVLAKKISITDTLMRLMISEEMDRPRTTYVLDRGAYDAPKQAVRAQTPRGVLPYPEHLPANRLGLAAWLFDPSHPLTARVAVNRYWQMIFGQGIVKTPHDFGSQGSLPSHPRLLDYLATDFRESGWDVRALLRKMVLSAAYQRSSTATEELREVDPENTLLASGPAGRLPAELIRDNALAASGLLVNKVGGPSVKPYQPKGLWIQANNFSQMLLHYIPDEGDNLYRRSMYTFIKRTAPPPFLTNFDASGRDICMVKRSTTNTPLQALNLLNDPQFVETARVLAQRVQLEKEDTNEQLAHAFRLVAGRKAKAEELGVLRSLFEDELLRFRAAPSLADSLLAIGDYPVPDTLDPLKTAALASVGNVLFSFDEAYVKR